MPLTLFEKRNTGNPLRPYAAFAEVTQTEMRDFGKLTPQFWIGYTGRRIHDECPEATVVASYLVSSPHSNMLGLYYLPKLYLAHETGLGFEGALKGLQRVIEVEFCQYDDPTEMVFVFEMARIQIAEQLEPKDNRCRWVQREYDTLPENPFLPRFYEKYASAFHLKNVRGKKVDTGSPLEGPSEPLRSQEQEREQEREQEKEQRKSTGVCAPVPGALLATTLVLSPPPKGNSTTKKRAACDGCDPADPRHGPIRQLIQESHVQHFRVRCEWDASEGKALDTLLAANPGWPLEDLQRMVRNRFSSDGIPSERPRVWLQALGKYAGGALDRFGKTAPLHGSSTKKPNGGAFYYDGDDSKYERGADVVHRNE